MPDSPAERARRARRHKKGDHTLCDPARRCEALDQIDLGPAEPAAASSVYDVERDGLGPGGQELWTAMVGLGLPPGHRVLLNEACRIVDRLDRLDSALERKKTWLRFETADGGELVIIVDNVLAEARQQASTLKALIAEIRTALPKSASGLSPTQPKGGGLADLTARIALRGR